MTAFLGGPVGIIPLLEFQGVVYVVAGVLVASALRGGARDAPRRIPGASSSVAKISDS